MHNIYARLSGGLGNQLFQYATARALALRNNAKLVLDPWSGFVRDKEYGRVYELGEILSAPHITNAWSRLPLYTYRLTDKLGLCRRALNVRFLHFDFYVEQEFRFEPILLCRPLNKFTWLIGYWQSPKYFSAYEKILRAELILAEPKTELIRAMGELVHKSEAVALGVRLYEESSQPSAHARDGVVKTVEDLNGAIRRLREIRPQAKFFVFCTHRSDQLRALDLPDDTVFIIANEGFSNSVECLWLLAQCKHHIFTNSTYYWWGAWLSEAVHNREEQLIFAADNFINIDGLCDHWQRF